MKKLVLLGAAVIIGLTSWTLGQPGAANSWGDAQWIWDEADANKVPQNNEPRYMRLSFNLSGTPQAAELWVTADNLYVAYVNGQKVGDGKEWAQVDRYDVAKHLVAGKNVVAIKATNAGGVAGAIARLHVKTADKKDLFVVTNDKTKIQRAGSVSDGKWTKPDFDDSAWFNAIALGDPSIAPWNLGGSAVAGKGKKGSPAGKGYDTTAVTPVKGRLTPQEQQKLFVVPKDFEIELVAADPVIINPITMVMDDKGRIIVSESHTYRYGPPGSPIKPYANPVIRLDPDGKGGFTRTLIADGFTDPVMGIAIKGNKLWLTACDYLYTYDLPADGDAKGGKAKDARRPLDDKHKEQLKKLRAVAADERAKIEQRTLAVWKISKIEHPDAVDALLTLLPGDSDVFTAYVGSVLVTTGSDKALSVLEKLGSAERNRHRPPIVMDPLENQLAAFEIAWIRIKAAELIKAKAKKKEAPTEGKGIATNKKLLLKDHSKAWNPFGMFVLEWGPDGKLYMSVGNHNINIEGPDGAKISARGGSGLVMRMNPDGTKMERLVHGLRVPYSFEMDPFGQLWLLSNGEGNPNRFVRVIEGVDYHCYSRGGVDNNWLAGNHPLAPPSEELHRGANTQLMRYYGAAFPQEYQGNLFLCNWGAHGFAGNNRAIIRFVPDERNNIVKREPLVYCTDPHFRPAHIMYDTDGSLFIADWYGRDDESDMTGRIWRLKYVGKEPKREARDETIGGLRKDFADKLNALGAADHLVRRKAMEDLAADSDYTTACQLGVHAKTCKNPMGAANALWVLASMAKDDRKVFVSSGVENPDWRVRRLAHQLMRRENIDAPRGNATEFKERDPAVLLSLALLAKAPVDSLVETLKNGAASDVHVRYEVAWHFAKSADEKAIALLLTSDDADVRLAGLIAIDIACYENTPAKKAALAALAKALENPGKLDHQLLLEVARLDGDASIVPALAKLIERDDLPAATVAKAVLVLKAKAGGTLASSKLSAAAGKRLIEAVEKGSLKIASPADQLVIFEFLESEGPTPFALKQIGGQLQSSNKELRLAAHTLARRFGPKADSLTGGLWPSVLNPKTKFEDAIESLSTIARTEKASKKAQWEQLLKHGDPLVRMEAVRWWRRFDKEPDFIGLLNERAVDLNQKDPDIGDDLYMVGRHLSGKTIGKGRSKDELSKQALEALAKIPAADRSKRAAMGQQVFERNSCTKCHTTATATTLLAPSLKGVAGQKIEYLIESVLHPSKIIKTGWEVENIELKNGKVITGLVKDEGKTLRVIQAMDYTGKPLVVDKADIDSRSVSKISLMPDGQEATLSRREFVDLIAYLQTLK